MRSGWWRQRMKLCLVSICILASSPFLAEAWPYMDCSITQPAPFTLGSVVARYDAPTKRVFLEARGKFITGDFTAAATNECKPTSPSDLFARDSLSPRCSLVLSTTHHHSSTMPTLCTFLPDHNPPTPRTIERLGCCNFREEGGVQL